MGSLWLPSPGPRPRRCRQGNLGLSAGWPTESWTCGDQVWGPQGPRDSLGYLPEVLTAVADAAGTACPPCMQPGQPH